MYCKFCGSVISSNSTKCATCGAKIDLNDGGQSFFDDHELEAWQSDSVMMSGPRTSMPKTEMRESSQFDNPNIKNGNALPMHAPQNANVGNTLSRKRPKKKTMLDRLNLSSANKLIIFCIASALAVVLLAVAIISVLNGGGKSGGDGADNSQTEEPVSRETDQTADMGAEVGNGDKTFAPQQTINDIKIHVKGKDVDHPVPAYMDNGKLYVSIDKILLHEGYSNGQRRTADSGAIRVSYINVDGSKTIEIEKGSDIVWIIEDGKETEINLGGKATDFIENETYVPARSLFIDVLGYSIIDPHLDNGELTVN